MSQSSTTPAIVSTPDQPSTDAQAIVGGGDVQKLLGALDDADCRAILGAASESTLTAKEVSEACDLSLSTTYRKLDLLTTAGLLEERTRIRQSGKHASEYTRSIEDIVISLDALGTVDVQV
ncbi:MAG: helix-turn-helix domain-containing protein [Halobacteriales archaeon]